MSKPKANVAKETYADAGPAEAAGAAPVSAIAEHRPETVSRSGTAVALAQAYSPPELLNLAIMKKSDITVIERMAALAERWQDRIDAERRLMAFNNAVADAKAKIPVIKKTSRVKFDSARVGAASTDYVYEDFAAVAATVAEYLGPVGLSYRYRLAQPTPDSVTVTCVLSHRDGHSEETPLTCKVDPSGNKNHIQAISSAVTYLERITLKAALGLAAGKDDDGTASGRPMADDGEPVEYVTQEQALALEAKCTEVGCPVDKFLGWADAPSFEQIPAELFDGCMQGIAAFKKKS